MNTKDVNTIEDYTTMPANADHILYSFRRCPYAMRARMAISIAGIPVELREVVLRDKPEEMLDISPKGSVPVLHLKEGTVIDESLGIMFWALEQNDLKGWLDAEREETLTLIERNDGPFKKALDRFKYPGRYPNEDCSWAKDSGLETLKNLNDRLERYGYLMADKPTLADYAIFPFVRQFAHADMDLFEGQNYSKLADWLEEFKSSAIFKAIMPKFKQWTPDDPAVVLMPLLAKRWH